MKTIKNKFEINKILKFNFFSLFLFIIFMINQIKEYGIHFNFFFFAIFLAFFFNPSSGQM